MPAGDPDIKIVGTVDPTPYKWRVLVEMDYWTLYPLVREGVKQSDAPKAGQLISLKAVLDRLKELESREADVRAFACVIAKFLPEPAPKE